MKRGICGWALEYVLLVGGFSIVNSAIALPVPLSSHPIGGYQQDFNSLATTGAGIAWLNESTIEGWSLFNAAGTALTTYAAGAGTSTAGGFYSFGSSAATDRALGGVGGGAYFGSPASGAVAGWIAVSFVNDLSSPISSLTVGWNGEQWRNGNGPAQSMVFEYGFGGTFATVTSWLAPGGTFDWTSPVTGVPAAAVDGNAAGLVANRGGEISQLGWESGATLWFRWVERNDAGNDHGLAIDDFSLTWRAQVSVSPGSGNSVPDAGATLTLLGLSVAGLGLVTRRRN